MGEVKSGGRQKERKKTDSKQKRENKYCRLIVKDVRVGMFEKETNKSTEIMFQSFTFTGKKREGIFMGVG